MTVRRREVLAGGAIAVRVVSENGTTVENSQRVQHLRESGAALASSIDRGLPVVSYVPRFDVVAVDRKTSVRSPKSSLAAYCRLIVETRRVHKWA